MTEIENKQKNGFFDTLKWYAVGVVVTSLVFYALLFFKVEMRNIVTCFQISSGILLGGLLQMRTRLPANK